LDPSKPSALAQLKAQAVRRLTALEAELRVIAARELLEALRAEQVIDLLAAILSDREAGDVGALTSLAAFLECISEMGETDFVSDLLIAARAAHQEEVVRLLNRPLATKDFNPHEERGVDRQLREQSLGYRKSLARTGNREMLLRLLQDPSEAVIRQLLEHPKLLEADVVRLAARRPARPLVQREIFLARRWKMRRAVRRALARNPYTPPEMALKLIPLLPIIDARAIAEDGTLHSSVRAAAGARVVALKKKQALTVAADSLADLEPEGDA